MNTRHSYSFLFFKVAQFKNPQREINESLFLQQNFRSKYENKCQSYCTYTQQLEEDFILISDQTLVVISFIIFIESRNSNLDIT